MAKRGRPSHATADQLRRPARLWWQRASVFAWAALVVAAVAAAVFIWPGRSRVDLRRIEGQNVLLITVDTLRADALGSYGGRAATPALDRLAAVGVRFDFAHAHAVFTLPSHASILTGLLPYEHGVRDNSGYRLPPDLRTAATLLKQAGYRTGAFVAAFPLDSRFGLDRGFDVYDDRVGAVQGPSDFAMPERPAPDVVAAARRWIGTPDASWFAWVHVFEPHAPYRPPAPFDATYAARPYDGEVAAVDAALAPLLDDLRAAARPTLVIVTADHGEGLGDHGEQAHGVFAYESTLRVPLIVAQLGGVPSRWPGSRAGEVSPVAARHVDLLPTILDAVGQGLPPGLAGRTLLPRDERRAGAAPRVTYFEAMFGMLNHGWAPLSGVIVGREKFIDLPIPERYDLAADPAETSNLQGRVPERDRMLASSLASFHAAAPGDRLAEDRDTIAQLRSLGYVTAQAPLKARYTEHDDPKRLVDLDSAIHTAMTAFDEGRLEDAERIYRQVVERRPDMAVAYRRLALIQRTRGDGEAAIQTLRQAVASGVTDPRALAQLGEYLTEANRVADGIEILRPLAENPATDTDASNALGIAYAQSGRTREAQEMFERLSRMLPRNSVPLENLGILALGRGDVPGATVYFERALSIAPESPRAQVGAGAAAFQGGDRQTAYSRWVRAIELDPFNLDALFSLGINLARDGRMDEARPYLTQFLQAAPANGYADQRREASRLLASPLR